MIAPTPFFADRGCHTQIYEEIKALQGLGHKIILCTYGLGREMAGVQTARQIQETPPPYRECYLCRRPIKAWDLKFVAVCSDEIDCSEAILHEEKRRGGKPCQKIKA